MKEREKKTHKHSPYKKEREREIVGAIWETTFIEIKKKKSPTSPCLLPNIIRPIPPTPSKSKMLLSNPASANPSNDANSSPLSLWQPPPPPPPLQETHNSDSEFYTEPYNSNPNPMYASTPDVWQKRKDHIYESAVGARFGSSANVQDHAKSKEHVYESLGELRRELAAIRRKSSDPKTSKSSGRLKRLSLDVTRHFASGLANLASKVSAGINKDEGSQDGNDVVLRRPKISSPISVTRRTNPRLSVPDFDAYAKVLPAAESSVVAIQQFPNPEEEVKKRITPPQSDSNNFNSGSFRPNGNRHSLAPLPEDGLEQEPKMFGTPPLAARRRSQNLHRRSVALGENFGGIGGTEPQSLPTYNGHHQGTQLQHQDLAVQRRSARRRLDYDSRCLNRRMSLAVMEEEGGDPNGCELAYKSGAGGGVRSLTLRTEGISVLIFWRRNGETVSSGGKSRVDFCRFHFECHSFMLFPFAFAEKCLVRCSPFPRACVEQIRWVFFAL